MDLNTELKDTIDRIGREWAEFRAENERKGVSETERDAKLAKISETLDSLEEQKSALERRLSTEAENRAALERRFNESRLVGAPADAVEAKAVHDFNLSIKSVARERGLILPSDVSVDGFRAYKAAFVDLMRKGSTGLSPEQVKTMQVGVDADGGYLVPADLSGRIVTRVYELSPIRSLCAVQSISSDRLEGITDLGEAGSGWVGETATRSDTNTPQIGKYEIPAHEQYAQPKATQKMLDDSSIDVESWLAGKVADKFARDEAAAFVVGDGVSKPRGFATYTTAATADATRAWGTLEHIVTGASGDFVAANAGPFDCLFDLEMAMKAAYLPGCSFITRRSVVLKLRKFKASDYQYIWQPSLQAGQPSTLIGYPIVLCEDMPAIAANSLSLAFGNLKEAYQIVDRLGVRTLRDPFTDKPYVKFYTIRRVGGAVVNYEALKFLKFST
jgi:HK97 family phage major capsid protein